MKVTTKGRVTIPLEIRQKLGITSDSEVDFVHEKGRAFLVKRKESKRSAARCRSLRGRADYPLSTDEILALTRK
ncbi:MAG: AbrB/MazE/SpoVT family DNA-binding domain-containing protein [Deltaproteobacteria bacterium]|nr:AbrB/MazE/SpoVT family DNA-binding domain-containing protein [Deltaproteobacteria bacterium]